MDNGIKIDLKQKFKKDNENMKIRTKHIIIFISILLVFTIIFSICFFYNSYLYKNNNIQNMKNEKDTEINIYETDNITNENNEFFEETKELNKKQKIALGLYLEKNGVKTLITSHSCSWVPENVMGVFYAVPCMENTLSLNTSFDTLWKEYISSYENYSSIRIGYNISFTLNNGESVNRTILNPDDAYYMFPKVMVFLYDDVNLVPGKRYYHITQDDMNENTICSSIKLVGDVDTKNIASDITLTAFCYTSEDDFDKETGKYTRQFFLQYNYI